MTQRRIGFMLIGLGSVVALTGIVLLIRSGSDSGDQAADVPATTLTTTASASAASSTITATTTSTTTTTVPPTPTTTSTTTTTSTAPPTPTTTTTTIVIDPSAEVEAFVAEFAAATASDDLEFLLARLHPLAVQSSDQATCDAFVEREIAALDQYRTTGTVETTTLNLTVAGASVTVNPAYVVPVAFSISGQSFTSDAHFAPVDGALRYFAGCR